MSRWFPVASRAIGDFAAPEFPEVLITEIHDLALVTMLALHPAPNDATARAIPLFLHLVCIAQPSQHALCTVRIVTKDIAPS